MFTLDPQNSHPPYEQLRRLIIAKIERGELSPGHKLPPVRTLASQLGLAPNTVAKTYRQLEADGFVRTAGRHGTIVSGHANDQTWQEAHQVARTTIEQLINLGLEPDDISSLLHRELSRFRGD